MPSAAFVSTISGFTWRSIGKPGRDVGKTIFCEIGVWEAVASGFSRAMSHIPTDWGIFQSALSVARYLPDDNGCGDVSIPSPVVTCTGVPPLTGTDQM